MGHNSAHAQSGKNGLVHETRLCIHDNLYVASGVTLVWFPDPSVMRIHLRDLVLFVL